MLKNYIKIAWRNLVRNKTFSAINVLGLSIGISASLVIYLLVNYHFTFDKFQKDGDRIYRVVSEFNFSGLIYRNSGITAPMGPAVKKELTGIEAVVPFRLWNGEPKVTVPTKTINQPLIFKKQKHVVFADAGFMNLIGYEWLAGSPATSLNQPYQTVLSETAAELYFSKLSPQQIIGKQLFFDDTVSTTITGIVRNIKQNTDFTFNTFISRATLENTSLKPRDWDQWDNTNSVSQLLLKLSPGTATQKIEKGLSGLYKKYHTPDPNADGSKNKYHLQPLSDIHFNPEYGGYDLPLAHKPTLYGLLAVAVFLLSLGCINFINLTTANAAHRAKEIGIRKTLGSSKNELVIQFLSETFLLTSVATLLSVFLTPLILKAFSGFVPEGLQFSLVREPGVFIFLLILIIIVTVLAGFYPAMVLSGYKPVLVLKNQAFADSGKTRNAWIRKSLTISQFVIAQVFIMATILVSKQISYSLNKDMGFKKDAIIYLDTHFGDTVQSHKYALMEKIRAIPEIAMMSLATSPPSSGSSWSGPIKYKDGKKEITTDVQQKFGDTNYLKLYNIKLLAGSNLEPSDTVTSFLINQTYARILGFKDPQQAIGKNLDWSSKQVPIRGVISDFNQRSLHESVKPLVIGSWPSNQSQISMLLIPQDEAGITWKSAISKVEKAFKEVYPQNDFEYKFVDQEIAKYYDGEKNISSLLKWATGLAVLISCLGLLGLVIYTTTQRTKEIGVRKILGASVSHIVMMITKDFLILILIAFAIAAPLAWLAMNKWLENFAYRTDISWWVFGLGISIMLLIAMLTLGFQTIRAALANPVKSLRTE